MQTIFAQVPSWQLVPEILAASLTPDMRAEASRIAEAMLDQTRELEEFRSRLSRVYFALKLLSPEVLASLNLDRQEIEKAHRLVQDLEKPQLLYLRTRLDLDENWKNLKEALESSLSPVLMEALDRLVSAGPLSDGKVRELEEFRHDILALLAGLRLLPPEQREGLELPAVSESIAQIRAMTPEMLYLVRLEIDQNPQWSSFPGQLHRSLPAHQKET